MSGLLEEHIQHLRAAGYAERTIKDRAELLTRIDGKLQPTGIDLISRSEVIEFLATPGWSAGTRETYFNHVTGFCRWVYTAGYWDFDPSEGLPRPEVPPRIPRPATDDTVAALLAQCEEPHLTRVLLAALAGARCIEISRLNREDITEDAIRLHGKGNKMRYVDTHEQLWEHLKDFPPGPITRNRAGERATPREVSFDTYMYFRRTLHVKTSLHRLRSWFATSFIDAGGDVPTLMQLMGHVNPQTTLAYTLVSNSRRRAAVARVKLPPVPN